MTDAELWCEGRPFCGRRPLHETEARDLEFRIRRHFRRMTLTDRFTAGGIILLVIGVAIAILIGRYSDPSPLQAEDVVPIFGLFFLAAGFLGSLLEIMFASRIAVRLIFSAVLIILLIAALSRDETQYPLQLELGAGAILVVVVGGPTMMVLGWKDRKRLRPVLEQAVRDCHGGEVLMFGTNGKAEIEILPVSHLTLRQAGVAAARWKVPFVTPVARAPGSFEAPVIGQAGEHVTSGGLMYNQRHMSAEEIQELDRIRKRTIRKGIISTTGMAYMCGLLLARFGDLTAAVRWLVALILAATYLYKHWQVWRNLRIDISTSMILVVRPNDEVERSAPIAEVLPASRLEWARNGTPSRWRVAKW